MKPLKNRMLFGLIAAGWILLMTNPVVSFAQQDSVIQVMGEAPFLIGGEGTMRFTDQLPMVRRGSLTMTDGTVYPFRKLRFSNDSVSFLSEGSERRNLPLADVKEVVHNRWQPAQGAAVVGLAGLAIGFLAGGAMYMEDGDFWRYFFSGDEDSGVRYPRSGYKIAMWGALGGAALGFLAGMGTDKEKIVYRQGDIPVEVFPEVNLLNHEIPIYGLTLKVGF